MNLKDFETSNFPVPTKAKDRGTSEWRIERRIPLGTGVFAVKQLVFKFNGAMDAIGGFPSTNWSSYLWLFLNQNS